MLLAAYDLGLYRSINQEKQLWLTTVMSTGSSNDLQLVFPFMVAASGDYVGTTTGQQVTIEIADSDVKVEKLKNLQNNQQAE